MSIISKSPFYDEPAAFEYLEKTLWPEGPVCQHCGVTGNATKLQGKATRAGVWKCKEKECRKQFTVRVGTVFEHGRIPLHKMLQATYLLCCSKKGISSHQLHRILQVTYKTAWFLSHRIREAMGINPHELYCELDSISHIGPKVSRRPGFPERRPRAPSGRESLQRKVPSPSTIEPRSAAVARTVLRLPD
jgi:transposase-like protein